MTLPNILRNPDAARAIADADRPGIVLDFDGTLSEIVPTPDSAVIHPRSAAALAVLAGRYALVAALSGRAVQDVADRVGVPGITYVGNHGAEHIVNGHLSVLSSPSDGIAQVLDHLGQAMNDIPGIVYEDKRFSASVHFRKTADPAAAERRLRRALADMPYVDEIDWFWGRMVLEIRPVTAVTKGDAIAALATQRSLDALIFVGDDTTDVDGMRRLPKLRGVTAIGVAVLSRETPPPLLEAARYALDGVEEVAELLELLIELRPANKSSIP